MFERIKESFQKFCAWFHNGTHKLPEKELIRLKQVCSGAHLVEEVAEIAIALFLFAELMGNISIPMFLSVSTSGWNIYAAAIWIILPTVGIVVFIQALFYHVKYGVYFPGGR